MTSVGLWTLRVATAARGRKGVAALIAAVEAVVFALTFSNLVADLGSPSRLSGYALGVAAGTALGLMVNERITGGRSELHVVAPGDVPGLADELGRRGWPVTWSVAVGPRGPVTQLFVAVEDHAVPCVTADVDELAPGSYWSLRALQSANPNMLPSACARRPRGGVLSPGRRAGRRGTGAAPGRTGARS
jgi:uncharacterized protein YebE (UPF0316 family)